MEQRGPSSKHTACVLAVRLPWQEISPIVSSNSLKEIASLSICVPQERLSVKTKDRALKELVFFLSDLNYR